MTAYLHAPTFAYCPCFHAYHFLFTLVSPRPLCGVVGSISSISFSALLSRLALRRLDTIESILKGVQG